METSDDRTESGLQVSLPTSQTPHSRTRVLRPGEELVRCGDVHIGVVTVLRGRLKRKRNYVTGEYLVGIAGPGACLALDEVLDSTSPEGVQVIHRETLQSIGATEVRIDPLPTVQVWLRQVPKSLLSALRGHTGEPSVETVLKRPLELLPVRARVAATIWALKERHGEREGDAMVLNLDLTREEIAHLAGTVYESVIRMLTRLKKEGVLELDGRKIRILNEDQLARIGQVVIEDEGYDEKTDVKNHSSKINGSSQEAC